MAYRREFADGGAPDELLSENQPSFDVTGLKPVDTSAAPASTSAAPTPASFDVSGLKLVQQPKPQQPPPPEPGIGSEFFHGAMRAGTSALYGIEHAANWVEQKL